MNPKNRLPTTVSIILIFIMATSSLIFATPQVTAVAEAVQQATDTTPPPTETDVPAQQDSFERPLMVIVTYKIDADAISAGQTVNLYVYMVNNGQETAENVVAIFTPGELVPTGTGGVVSVGQVHPNNHADINQPLTATGEVLGKQITSIDMAITYTDWLGNAYNASFHLTFPVFTPRFSGSTATPTPTPTAVPIVRPQLVITDYKTNVNPIQPGSWFDLELTVRNVGNSDGKRVTMIIGGGSASSPGEEGTPGPGGISGTTGDFTNFAPYGSSNVHSLGDLPAGSTLDTTQPLIVNVSTNPGAYSLKISFAYLDQNGRTFTDDQVVTMLVYSLPLVEVNFYREPGMLFAGQPNQLPLQLVNLGRKSAILGNMSVTSTGGELSNNTALIGTLESGGYYPLDATFIPNQPGPLQLDILIEYTDDFNQPQQINKTITVEVAEGPTFEPGMEGPGGPGIEGPGFEPQPSQETLWQKVLRFIRGMVGLDSGITTPQGPEGMPIDGGIEESTSVPAGPLKGP